MKAYSLDMMVTPVEKFIFALDDDITGIVLLLIAFLVVSSILVTVFVIKKHPKEKDTEEYQSNSDENTEE